MPALILLMILCLCGCAAGTYKAPQTITTRTARIPATIKEKAVIGLVPVLYPEPARKKDFYDYFLPPPDKDKYEQSKRYATMITNRIKESMEQLGFTPFVANPARTEDLYAPEFFEVLKISCPAEYCALIYLYELSNSEKKISRIEPEQAGDTPVEQWQHDAMARARIELYESSDMNLIWQYDVNTQALLIAEKKISGSASLDDLAYSLLRPHYAEQVNNEVALSTVKEMIEAFKSLEVKVNPNHNVKTDIYVYDSRMSNDHLIKDATISVSDIGLLAESGKKPESRQPDRQFITDANGQISLELPEGFYLIEARPAGAEQIIRGIQILIIGDVSRINIILK